MILWLGWPSSVESLFAEVEFLSDKALVGAVRVLLSDEDGGREGSVNRFEEWGWKTRVEGNWWHVPETVSLNELVGLCRFAGCEFSVIVSFVVRKTYLPKVLELTCLRQGIHVAGGAPKRK